ncbi:DUF4233 domain-containing protein [Citricoccus sp. GCM10030269]|uniref:DUF4233 domain-containing protein n=1 Tax=Citricoccus sp. GCM10030269 TaxID=3273388 RepID=UPI00360E8EDF
MSEENPVGEGNPETTGREPWRPARETKSQREWRPGQQKKPRSIQATFMSSVLVMEALVLVFFGLAVFGINRGEPLAPWALTVSLAVAVVAVLDCALVRKPAGIWIGWALQLALIMASFIEYSMAFVGVGFGLAWWYAVTKGRQIDRENRARAQAEARWQSESQ